MANNRGGAGRDWRSVVDPLLIFLVAAATYGAVAAHWLQINPITGDEPHYLVAAHALSYDGSLDVKPVYGHGVWAGMSEPGPPHVGRVGTALVTMHGLALPVLLALPYRLGYALGIGGILGAKLGLCVLTALLVARFPSILMRLTGDRNWSLAVATALALSLPYTMAAGQVYPDLLTGLICAWLIEDLAIGFTNGNATAGRMLRCAVMIGALPWLQHRHIVTAAVFGAAFMACLTVRRWRAPVDLRALRDVLLTPRRALALTIMLGLVALDVVFVSSGVAAGLGQQPMFRGWYSVMIALGLHLDQLNGIFFQNPILFGGLVGLPLFARAAPLLASLWAIVCAVIIAPVAAVPFGYGGWAPAGRYQWDLAPLWIFPLGAFLGGLLRQRAGKPILAGLLGLAMLLQATFAVRWLRFYEFFMLPMVGGATTPLVWAHNSLYGRLRYFVPLFASPEHMLTWVPNGVWLIAALACVGLGACLPRISRLQLTAAAILVAAAAVVLYIAPTPQDVLVTRGANLGGTVGQVDRIGRVASEPADGPGYVFVGPVLALDPGCYRVTVAYDADTPPAAAPTWDMTVFDPNPYKLRRIDGGPMIGTGSHELQHVLSVPSGAHLQGFQFRVRFPGKGVVRVKAVTMEPAVPCG